jgi:hypothetical protein
MIWDPTTKAYVERRTAEGKSDREIVRCLKRYLAREIFRLLVDPQELHAARICVDCAISTASPSPRPLRLSGLQRARCRTSRGRSTTTPPSLSATSNGSHRLNLQPFKRRLDKHRSITARVMSTLETGADLHGLAAPGLDYYITVRPLPHTELLRHENGHSG